VEGSSSENESDAELSEQTPSQASTPVRTPLPQPPTPLRSPQVHPGCSGTASTNVPAIGSGTLKYILSVDVNEDN